MVICESDLAGESLCGLFFCSILGMAASTEIVALDGRPATIYIGTAARMRKGVAHVWRYDLVHVGADRFYVCQTPPSTTFPGDVMFIVQEQVGGQTWYVAYEGRVVDGLLEQRSAVFRTLQPFWEAGNHEWEVNGAQSRESYEAAWVEPQWQASGWSVCTRHEM